MIYNALRTYATPQFNHQQTHTLVVLNMIVSLLHTVVDKRHVNNNEQFTTLSTIIA